MAEKMWPRNVGRFRRGVDDGGSGGAGSNKGTSSGSGRKFHSRGGDLQSKGSVSSADRRRTFGRNEASRSKTSAIGTGDGKGGGGANELPPRSLIRPKPLKDAWGDVVTEEAAVSSSNFRHDVAKNAVRAAPKAKVNAWGTAGAAAAKHQGDAGKTAENTASWPTLSAGSVAGASAAKRRSSPLEDGTALKLNRRKQAAMPAQQRGTRNRMSDGPVNLLQFAKPARTKGSQQQKKAKNAAPAVAEKGKRQMNPNMLDSGATTLVRRGKTRDPKFGKKHKMSRLKKIILRERRARMQLMYPEQTPVPLVRHAATFGLVLSKAGEKNAEDAAKIDATMSSPVFWGYEFSAAVKEENKLAAAVSPGETEAVGESGVEAHRSNANADAKVMEVKSASAKKVTALPFSYASVIASSSSSTRNAEDEEAAEKEASRRKKKKKKAKRSNSEQGVTKNPPIATRTGKVRHYVQQALSKKLDEHVKQLVTALMSFQKRLKISDPIKARMRPRIKVGLREVYRGVRSRKVKCVIVAPNIEEGFHKGGINDRVSAILEGCKATTDEHGEELDEVPVVFALNRRKLGYLAIGKAHKGVSVIAIYNADGAYEHLKPMIKLAGHLRAVWKNAVTKERADGKCARCSFCTTVLEVERNDCLKCSSVACGRCTMSRHAKKVPCLCANNDADVQDNSSSQCEYVRIARHVTVDMVTKSAEEKDAAATTARHRLAKNSDSDAAIRLAATSGAERGKSGEIISSQLSAEAQSFVPSFGLAHG